MSKSYAILCLKNGEVTGLAGGKKIFSCISALELAQIICLPAYDISQNSPFPMSPSKEKVGTLIWAGLSER